MSDFAPFQRRNVAKCKRPENTMDGFGDKEDEGSMDISGKVADVFLLLLTKTGMKTAEKCALRKCSVISAATTWDGPSINAETAEPACVNRWTLMARAASQQVRSKMMCRSFASFAMQRRGGRRTSHRSANRVALRQVLSTEHASTDTVNLHSMRSSGTGAGSGQRSPGQWFW